MKSFVVRCLFGLSCAVGITNPAHAQPRDTLTTEQLLQRKGTAYASLLKPARYLALDVNHVIGGFRRYRFFEGDELHFRARGETYRDPLYEVTDSTFSILVANQVMNRDEPVTFRLNEVERMYFTRRIPFVSQAGTIFPLAGAVYLLASVINTGSLDAKVLPVTGAFVVSGLIFHRMSNLRVRINKNHRLKVLRTY